MHLGMVDSKEHLSTLHATLEDTNIQTRDLVRGLSDAQRLWRPDPKSWGIAHCFDHLIVTGNLYHPRIRMALKLESMADHPSDATLKGTFARSWFGRAFLWFAGPTSRVRIRTFRIFRPQKAPDPRAPEAFLKQQEELKELLEYSAEADLQTVRIVSPQTRFLTLRLGECLEMLVLHQQRHLQQAQRVTESEDFPKA